MSIRKLSSILSLPAGYRLFSRLVRGNAWETYISEYIKPASGEKVLDIGCGPADILDYLPAINYTGVDLSQEYIDSARNRFGNRGRFLCSDVGSVEIEAERGSFSLVLATGLIHHLDNRQAAAMFEMVRRALRPEGRFITFDGCYVPGQSPMARWFLARDRGQFVRTQEEYTRLASEKFSAVEMHLRHDLLRIPYTHLIMRCSNPAS
jgi:SAM-dependent methyltransferase